MALSSSLPTAALLFLTFFSQVNADCKTFTQSGEYYTEIGGPLQRLSQGYVCDTGNSDYENPLQMRCGTNQCPTIASGVVNEQGTNNLSLSMDDALPLYTLISSQATNLPLFLYSLNDNAENISSCMAAGNSSAGFWAFTPSLVCINGTLSDCKDGPVDDGTAINVCGVGTFGSAKDPGLNGESAFVVTDPESAAKLTNNPAASASPVAILPSQYAKAIESARASESAAASSESVAATHTNAAGGVGVPAFDMLALGAGIWTVLCAVLGTSLIL